MAQSYIKGVSLKLDAVKLDAVNEGMKHENPANEAQV
jgi:hypothetical protein